MSVLPGCSKKEKEQVVEQPVIDEQPAESGALRGGEAGVKPEEPEKPPEDPFTSLDAPADVAAPPSDAKKSKSGLAWKVVRKGTGTRKGGLNDSVFVHYTSWQPDGKRTATTRKRGQPKELRIGKAVPGWKETFQDMVEGERRRVWMPSKLAHPRSKRRKGGPRTVDFELVRLVIAPDPPKDVKKAPRSAQKSDSGLKWIVLKPGDGEPPAEGAMVTVKYAGWTTDGKCFDHTPDDETMSFDLNSVIPGWREGINDMVAGEKRRFWIPKKLAYDGAHGKPQGTLVFDIELIESGKPPAAP